uniref:Uncharacterized protein n=1 Tax=viral metagenome TaxID=1070528 RepID=A0A6H1ZXB8_9ZZZZ
MSYPPQGEVQGAPIPGNFTSLNLGDATLKTGNFPSFDAAESQILNIIGLGGNNPVVRQVRLWLKDGDDPGVDVNVNCRLSFYNSDPVTEDELLIDFFFNLTYTETNGGASATDTTDTVDSISGLIIYDLIRYTGGIAENVRLTAAPTGTTLTFTALANNHADNTGIVRVAEINEVFQLYDADGTNEIHAKLEMLSDPGAAVQVTIELDVQ